jgi:hypothetical protein
VDRDLFELVIPSDVVEVVMRVDDAQRQWRHARRNGANRQDAHSRVEENGTVVAGNEPGVNMLRLAEEPHA